MVFSATFNNISVISWRYVLLVEEIGEPGENNQPVSQVSDKLYPMMLYTMPWAGFELISLEIDGHFPNNHDLYGNACSTNKQMLYCQSRRPQWAV